VAARQDALTFGRPSATWRRFEAFAETRLAAVVLFVAALCAFALESVALPVAGGRDFGGYLRWYVQFWDSHTVLPIWTLTRAPIASLLVAGPLDLGGVWLATVVFALLFAASVVCWALVASRYGPRATILTAVALLVWPAYGVVFHELGSDAGGGAAFALWALLVVRAIERPSTRRVAAAGLGVALLTLVRPGNQVLVGFALLALLLPGSWRRRLALGGIFLASAVAPLLAWSALNSIRYGDFTIVRGRNVFVFSRAFTHHLVAPSNGPSTRALARAVDEHLLPLEPYRSYHVDEKELFASGSFRMLTDLFALSDRYWGWGTDYAIIRKAGWEAVKKHPLEFSGEVATTIATELRQTAYGTPPAPAAASSTAEHDVVVGGQALPKPSEGQPIPSSHWSGDIQRPGGGIDEVWTSPTEHHVVFASARNRREYDRLQRDAGRLDDGVPAYGGSSTLLRRLNQASRWFPRPVVWLLVGLVGLVVRRPRRALAPLALVAAVFVVLAAAAVGVDAVPEYVIPLAPAFVLLAAVALLGERRERLTQV